MEKELKCPHCGRAFSVDESEYAELLNQVKNESFNEELNRRMAELKKTEEAERKAALADLARISDKVKAEKDQEISLLKQQLNAVKQEQETKISLALAEQEQKINKLFADKEAKLSNMLSEKTDEIAKLNTRISQNEADKKIALLEAQTKAREELQQQKDIQQEQIRAKENEIAQLKQDAKFNEQNAQFKEKAIHDQYKEQLNQKDEHHRRELQMKDEVIAQYRDFKAKQSTKMIGESLEVFCNNQFETMVHPYLPSAQFGKDNEVIDHTKGDFIFRDFADGIESVSIMFEMKNEADETQVKHKNSDFFGKLDTDRKKKKCEYAVLVTLLELDNDLYNSGIYAVPGYEKMFVVRPQQFLSIIALLVQTGRNTVQVKKELAEAKNREVDVTHFEEKLDNFKRVFGGHVEDAAKRYQDALSDIDNAITQLTNMKEHLRLWVEHLYKADKNMEDLTIRKLTYQNPTMKVKFDEAKKKVDED
ncbi:MAG: DUF2130 domain-containing protein [Bacteroidaceae bacterium]|nr:DUF2130 domain-containing protein [Bacteroidaceae bacterium]